ncbi:MAG TPA: hypothetical protein VK662_12540 [Acidothermaceae bacterium]|jgi:hypothetical protein|nr:hypothetical protein [Acidothermaceae bacterium]
MSEPTPVMHVQENRRSGQRGDVWSVLIEGENDGNSVGSVGSWKQAQELAASKNATLEPPSPGLRREMVEAGIPREEFGESSAAALFSHPHGVPDI